MSNRHLRTQNLSFASLNVYILMLVYAIVTEKICTGASLEEETMESIYKDPRSKLVDSASNNELDQLDSIDENIKVSISDEQPGKLIDSFENDNKDGSENDSNLFGHNGKESSLTRNLVSKGRKPSQSEEEEEEDYCTPQNKTDKKKTINISATTSTVTKISIIMDGDDDDDDDDDDEDDDACTPTIIPFTTETTTKKCSVCTSKHKEECNKEDENGNDNNFKQVPTRFVCTVTTEEMRPGENNNDTSADNPLKNQEEPNDDVDDNFEPVKTGPIFMSSTERLRHRRNYYKNYNSYKNQLRNKAVNSNNKQDMSKEEKIQKIQALLQDIQHKLDANGNRLKGQVNELRVVKEKMDSFDRNIYKTCDNDAEIDDDLLDKLRKALIKQYKTENKFASDDYWDNRNFENERLMFDGQGGNAEGILENIYQQNGQYSLKHPNNKLKANLEQNYNGICKGRSNLLKENRWRNTDRIANYQNKYDGRSGQVFDFNKNDMDSLRSIMNLEEEQGKSNLVEVNSENLKRSINKSQETMKNAVEDKSNENDKNVAAQENSSPVYISQIYLIDSNGSNSKIN